jgi:NADP-dependent 3-hydroxy acid dehydrogenase YdfG
MGLLTGSTAVVTGASSGIGRAIAIRLGEAGAHVFLAGRRGDSLEEAAARVAEAGGEATTVVANVREPREVQDLVDRASATTGRLDVMVNNAGVSYRGPIAEGDPEAWREMLEVNVLAMLVGSQAAIRAMRRCGANGHIVNVSSSAGRLDGTGVYGATKSAVNAIATSLRQELENDTIRVVNVIPGPTATNLARHQPDMLRGVARIVGADSDLNFDAPLPATMLDRIAVAASSFLASADDVARAVMFAISQPIELNVFEVSVLPPRRAPSLR